MSAIKRIVLICDSCHDETDEDDNETSVRYLRASSKKLGWRTGLKPTLELPSSENKSDLCSSCVTEESNQ